MMGYFGPERMTGVGRGLFGRQLALPAPAVATDPTMDTAQGGVTAPGPVAGVGTQSGPLRMFAADRSVLRGPYDTPGFGDGAGEVGGGVQPMGSAVTAADMNFDKTASHVVDGLLNAKPRRSAWGPDGWVTNALGLLGDAFSGNHFYANEMARRRDAERLTQQRMQDRQWAVEDRDARLNAPDYFMSGRDRVRYDPRTGASSVIYDAPEDYQAYATGLGYEPGTPEYNRAAQDYVLRGNGPTAYEYDVGLEEARQTGRENIEGMRQRNRINLRGMPTYRDLNPRTGGGGGGGGGRAAAPRTPTMAGTMAPILGKVAAGKQLTPGEQQAWTMYRSGRGGRGGNGGGQGGAGAGAAGTGNLPRPVSRGDFAKLPKGAKFIDPQGTVRVK